MKIAIIGAGFTGLAAAWDLTKAGHTVTVFEASDQPGGLAAGFQEKNWDWTLEKHYHHIFESDKDIQNFVAELGLGELLFFSEVKTKTRMNGKQHRLDSALTLLQFPELSWLSKFRTAMTLAFLKYTKVWKILETITAKQFLQITMGSESWQKLWHPLFSGKFGQYAETVNAAWFWARIHVRSDKLGYFKGGFANLADEIVKKLKTAGVKFYFSTPVKKISPLKNGHFRLQLQNKSQTFDRVLVGAPSGILRRLVPELPQHFVNKISQLQGLGAQTLILQLNQPFFTDGTYWLNINETGWPFLAVVEHTNLTHSTHYGHSSILYVGKYLKPSDSDFKLDQEKLLKKYTPYLKKLNPSFHKHIVNSWLFKEGYAQPIVPISHSLNVPSLLTPIPNLYWASMQHVYPWDRGTNYAVKVGREVATMMCK